MKKRTYKNDTRDILKLIFLLMLPFIVMVVRGLIYTDISFISSLECAERFGEEAWRRSTITNFCGIFSYELLFYIIILVKDVSRRSQLKRKNLYNYTDKSKLDRIGLTAEQQFQNTYIKPQETVLQKSIRYSFRILKIFVLPIILIYAILDPILIYKGIERTLSNFKNNFKIVAIALIVAVVVCWLGEILISKSKMSFIGDKLRYSVSKIRIRKFR